MSDGRNLIDAFKGKDEAEIIRTLDAVSEVTMEIAVENLERDFNMGSIVRSANAFGVRHVHVVGRKQWNRRGAMATDRYLHVYHHESVDSFVEAAQYRQLRLIGVDNLPGATDILASELPARCVLVFGSEADGLSQAMADACDRITRIMQRGSTRSLNVGAAAAVAMHEWCRRHVA